MALLSLLAAASAPTACADEVALQEWRNGERTEVNLAWWPDLKEDATEALQEALNSTTRKIIIPKRAHPYIVRPLFLERSGVELIFEEGAELVAKKGAFTGKHDCLLTVRGAEDIVVRGNGAVFRMEKNDFREESISEWRHALSLLDSRGVLVEDLTLLGSGGDGIYIRDTVKREKESPGATIRRVRCIGHHRQGMSIISGQNILVEDSEFRDTSGTPPSAGIDIEPSGPEHFLKNITIKNCKASGNYGGAFMIYLGALKGHSEPVSVRFEDCHVVGGNYGLIAAAVGDNEVAGSVLFTRCVVEKTNYAGIYVYDKASKGAEFIFQDCVLKDVVKKPQGVAITPDEGKEEGKAAQLSRRSPREAPIAFYLRRRLPPITQVQTFGGVRFENCFVEERKGQGVLAAGAALEPYSFPIESVHGTIFTRFSNPTMELGEQLSEVSLKLVKKEGDRK